MERVFPSFHVFCSHSRTGWDRRCSAKNTARCHEVLHAGTVKVSPLAKQILKQSPVIALLEFIYIYIYSVFPGIISPVHWCSFETRVCMKLQEPVKCSYRHKGFDLSLHFEETRDLTLWMNFFHVHRRELEFFWRGTECALNSICPSASLCPYN